MRVLEVADRADVTPRQVQFWVTKGYIVPRAGGGTGNGLDFNAVEAEVIIMAGRLLKIGLRAELAVEYARVMIEEKTDTIEVAGFLISAMPAEDPQLAQLEELEAKRQ